MSAATPVALRGIRGIIACAPARATHRTPEAPWIPQLSRVTLSPRPPLLQPVRTAVARSVLSPRPSVYACPPPQRQRCMAPSQSQTSQPSASRHAPYRQCPYTSVLGLFAGILRIRSASYGYCAYLCPSTALFRRSLHAPPSTRWCQHARRAQTPLAGELNVMHDRLMPACPAQACRSELHAAKQAVSRSTEGVLDLQDFSRLLAPLLSRIIAPRHRTLARRGAQESSASRRHFRCMSRRMY